VTKVPVSKTLFLIKIWIVDNNQEVCNCKKLLIEPAVGEGKLDTKVGLWDSNIAITTEHM
jgi:hypothetical protein